MTGISAMLIFTTAAALLLTSAASLSTSSPPAPLPSSSLPPPVCTDDLVAISPCLGYISTEPNIMTETPPSQCCDALKKAFSSGEGNCFCYLIKQPLIFGFPLNQSRVVSLPSGCLLETVNDGKSLESICSGSPALPPLHSVTGPVITEPSNSGPAAVASPSPSLPTVNPENSSAPINLAPEPGNRSPIAENRTSPSLLPKATSHSSAMRRISSCYSRYLPEALIVSAVVLNHL